MSIPERIDFSQAHFLDHSIWDCHGLPGGRRRHLAYRWEYHWRPTLRRHTMCRLGAHESILFWRGGGVGARAIRRCGVCLKRL